MPETQHDAHDRIEGNKYTLDDSDRARIEEIVTKDDLVLQGLYTKAIETLDALYASSNPITAAYPFLPTNFSQNESDCKTLKKLFATLQVRLEKDKDSPIFSRIDILALQPPIELPLLLKYAQDAYSIHIPAYQDMFDELDNRRAENPYMQEVFIGRDATFMYQARKIQYILRGEKRLKRLITYINFPRRFTDPRAVSIPQARQYLADHGVHSPDNATFIDTGYVGSIPEYIIRHVFDLSDVSPEYMNNHILLINGLRERVANPNANTTKGGNRVTAIEASPLHDSTATHVYQHKSGKLEAYGDPNDPITRFYYDLLRHIIMRHFYLEELYKQGKLEQQREVADPSKDKYTND